MRGNADTRRLSTILEGFAAEAVPDSLDLWPAIRSRLLEQQPRRDRLQVLPAIRVSWAAMAFLLIIVLVAVAYAASNSIVSNLFWRHVTQAGLARELNLAQTIDGITVRLERAYADSNVVLLGFTVSGPSDEKLQFSSRGRGGLWTQNGNELPGMIGVGAVPGSSVLGEWHPSERMAAVFTFDASPAKATRSELALRFETDVRRGGPGGPIQVRVHHTLHSWEGG
ncbi:MAG: DUF4179 domain-containing protein [Chloroflexi bacterium]|nr:DUF4179 domain-containing protein [Chloroflexota bacterium]